MSVLLIPVTLTPRVLMYLVHSPVLATVDFLEMDSVVKVMLHVHINSYITVGSMMFSM